MPPSKSVPLLLGALALCPLPAEAREVVSATTLGAGRTGHADPRDESAISHAPALLALEERYDLGGHLGLGPEGAFELAAFAIDARESPVGLGLHYRRLVHEPPFTIDDLPGWQPEGVELRNVERYHDFVAGVSVPTLQRRLAFGLGASLSFQAHDRVAPPRVANLGVSVATRPVPELTFAVSARNLVPAAVFPDPLTVGGGGRYVYDELLAVSADVAWRQGEGVGWGAGLQTMPGEARVLLGAYGRPDQPVRLTAGLGAETGPGGLFYSAGLPLRGLTFASLEHRVGLRIRA